MRAGIGVDDEEVDRVGADIDDSEAHGLSVLSGAP
jgi:hypothetical protein